MRVTPCTAPTPSASSATRSGSAAARPAGASRGRGTRPRRRRGSRARRRRTARARRSRAVLDPGRVERGRGQGGRRGADAPTAAASSLLVARGGRAGRGRRGRSRRPAGRRAARRPTACPSSTAASQARSSARASSGPRSPSRAAAARLGVAEHHALDHPQHRRGVGRRARRRRVPSARTASAIALCAQRAALPWSPRASARPARTCARNSSGVAAGRRLGERAADVDPGVVVGPADARPAVRLDVDRRGQVELGVARAVAHLPGAEQLGEPAPVARRERRGDGVERVRERAGDLALVQVGGDDLDVAGVRLEPVVVVRRDAEAEHVDALRLAAEGGGQLLRDEHVRPVGDRQDAVDRVVVRDRHEVHPAPLGERVDLLGRRGALRQPERALDGEAGDRGRRRVAVQIDPGHVISFLRTCRIL